MLDTMSNIALVGGNPFGLRVRRGDTNTRSSGMFIVVDPRAAGRALRVRQVVVGQPLGSDWCRRCTPA